MIRSGYRPCFKIVVYQEPEVASWLWETDNFRWDGPRRGEEDTFDQALEAAVEAVREYADAKSE